MAWLRENIVYARVVGRKDGRRGVPVSSAGFRFEFWKLLLPIVVSSPDLCPQFT